MSVFLFVFVSVSLSAPGTTRVAVSSTPGKTKHFQTIMLADELMLCDCPGLVFPSFISSTAEMIAAGILPINQMREYVQPAALITSRIPLHLLNATYGISIQRVIDMNDSPDRPPTPSEFLCAYCRVKGYITSGTGRWDEFRACKQVLRDYVDGKLLFAMPPELDGLDREVWMAETESIVVQRGRVSERLEARRDRDREDGSDEPQVYVGGQTSEGCEMVFGDFDMEGEAMRSAQSCLGPDVDVPPGERTGPSG